MNLPLATMPVHLNAPDLEPGHEESGPAAPRRLRLGGTGSMRLGIGIVITLALLAIMTRFWAPYDPKASGVGPPYAGPSLKHLFGTDRVGADVFSRTLSAATTDFGITLAAVLIAFIIGTFLGALAGYYGGVLDIVTMRVMEILQAFPSLLLAMLMVAAVGSGILNVIVVVSIIGIPNYVRLVRAEILSKKNWQFADAARIVGNRPSGILFRHLLPNSTRPLIAFSSINASWVAIIVASLGFIGLGIEPGTAEWGSMISRGQDSILSGEWWISGFPGIALLLMSAAFYLIGDGLTENQPSSSGATRGKQAAPAATPSTAAIPAGRDDLLQVIGYSAGFHTDSGFRPVLRDVTFGLRRSVITAIVGETGSGKTLSALSMLGIAPKGLIRTSGQMIFDGRDLFATEPQSFRDVRGKRISLVFQDARGSLNPVFTVGHQLIDVCRINQGVSKKEAEALAIQMLERVRIPEPARRMKQYPHEFSGGMAQRVMLALALISRPELLVLDEPTTGLDVTIQADIMALIVDLVATEGLTACLITHDLGVVAENCQDVVVMRDGEVREIGTCEQIFTDPQDEYTRSLLAASRLVEAA
jgi:peptide/nickel transport system permease protein